MSIPTHNLYDFVHQTLENKFIVKYFYPYGSKELLNLIDLYPSNTKKQNDFLINQFKNNLDIEQIFPADIIKHFNWRQFQSVLLCHDQEPLNFDFYTDLSCQSGIQEKFSCLQQKFYSNLNLRAVSPTHCKKYWVLLHSEINSPDLDKYHESGKYKTAYWWSHAAISRDWFRFAKYDQKLLNKSHDYLFLVYCRDTTGSREYRSTFKEYLTQLNLDSFCNFGSQFRYGIDHADYHGKWLPEKFYKENDVVEYNGKLYQFNKDHVVENFFNIDNWNSMDLSEISSNLSASYDYEDIVTSSIHVVLETVFDQRIHLTEKTLRPIACAQPFIVANGPGTLEYLRSYGYKTFSPWINEDYDKEINKDKRIKMIADEMHRIANLSSSEKKQLQDHCDKIAKYNQKIFFSDEFFDKIVSELKENVSYAYEQSVNHYDWKTLWKGHKERKNINPDGSWRKRRLYVLNFIRHLKKGGTLEDYVPPDLD